MLTPSFALNFISATLDPRVTFTRALNTATVNNADGSISLVNADTPRFDYANGVCRGLLIEEQRTNLFLNSVFSGAVAGSPGTPPTNWSNVVSTGSISAVNASTYAAGNALTFTCTAQRRIIFQLRSVTANTTFTTSFDVTVIASAVQISQIVDLRGKPAGASNNSFTLNGAPALSNTSAPVGTHKITVATTTAATAGTIEVFIGLGVQTNATSSVAISNIQFEAGISATSYIPTTTTALTRNADVATITGTNFSDFWQASKGGAQVFAIPSTVSGIRPLVQFDDGTVSNIIALRGNAADPELQIVDGGAPQVQLDAGTIVANTPYSLTGWWSTDDCKARQNSGATVSDYTATIPTVTQARLGSDGTNYLNGHLATINYYDRFSGQIYDRRKNKAVFSLL